MRLTRFGSRGLIFYLAMVGAFLAAPYSNLFFLLLAFQTLLWLLSFAWTMRNFRGVTAEILALEPTPAGVGQPLRVRFRAGRGRRFQITALLELEGEEDQ